MGDGSSERAGLALGIGAYGLWGALPLYLHLLSAVPPAQVLAHRILWSLLLLGAIVLLGRRLAAIRAAARGATLLALAASATLIAGNWFIYIWSVANHHMIEASLGYFVTPLVNVLLGLALLGERLGRLQGLAILLAAAGVAALVAAGGGALWITLGLAFTFSIYGVIRKRVAIDALGGLTVETLLLAPLALALLLLARHQGDAAFGTGTRLDLLLVLAGPVTAVPLLMFAAAARRLRYATMGVLQYIAPTLQFLEAVLLFGEPVRRVDLIGFALIWAGCALYAGASLAGARTARAPSPPPSRGPAASGRTA
ncbi:EamA family transporter RarD [Sphingomonas morindae]|uniref:EamA family transporter RarD n=1 Tax=Sphingomonas morindae TaxID=1541170 RepID=A0ABY4XD67_9SPHN|nr:EamA family transporter RarD [Sphingomonas morindae]USI74847.1 EamA family transporter RarD [Sphingomonas morindae]